MTVAFQAGLSHDITNPRVGDTIIFDSVLTNLGYAYSNLNGIFTAPVSGTYMINLVLGVTPQPQAHGVHLFIMKGTSRIGYIHADNNIHLYLQRSDTVVVHLNQGDDIWVKVSYSTGNNTIYGGSTHFDGVLIQKDK
jgi:hypothetical protein